MRIVLFGVTGNTGPRIIDRLLSLPAHTVSRVVAVTRSTQTDQFLSSGLSAVTDPRLRVVEADIRVPQHRSKLRAACASADAVSICSLATNEMADNERRVVRAAAEAGIRRIVQIGIPPQLLVDGNSKSHGGLQRQVRQTLRELPIRTVFVGCNYFQQSVKYYGYPLAFTNKFRMPVPPETALRFIHADDVARFVCAALLVADDKFDALARVHTGADLSEPGADAGPHWDMPISGPEVWEFRQWADWLNANPSFDNVRFEECSADEFVQALRQAIPAAGFAENVANNHVFMGAVRDTGLLQQPTPPELFGLVEGISPSSSADLLKYRPFFDQEFIPMVLRIRQQAAAAHASR